MLRFVLVIILTRPLRFCTGDCGGVILGLFKFWETVIMGNLLFIIGLFSVILYYGHVIYEYITKIVPQYNPIIIIIFAIIVIVYHYNNTKKGS